LSQQAQLNQLKHEIEKIDDPNNYEKIDALAQKVADLFKDHVPLKEIISWFKSFKAKGYIKAIEAIFFCKIGQYEAAKLTALQGQRNDNTFPHWSDLIKNIIMNKFENEHPKE